MHAPLDTAAEEMQAAGVEAIMLSRRTLEMHTQMHGVETEEYAYDMVLLAQILDYFNNFDDDEIIRLYEQANAMFARVQGSLSPNVATCEKNLGNAYLRRANRARAAHDLDRYVIYLELALSRFREATRIYRAINRVERADIAEQSVNEIEAMLQRIAVETAEIARDQG